MLDPQMAEIMRRCYLLGFLASGEGHNGEYPYGDHGDDPAKDPDWAERRDTDLFGVVKP